MSWSRRLFRLLVRAYPPHIRQTHGDDMWLTFEEDLRDARSRGRLVVFDLWRRELLAAWRARCAKKRSRRQSWQRSMRPRSLPGWMDSSSLDVKLGFRILIKHPGLTVVSVFAMSIGMIIGAGYFEFVHDLLDPVLPFEDGERMVGMWNWDAEARGEEPRSLHDFLTWRDQLTAVEEIGAAAPLSSNLITGDGRAEPVRGVAMSASGFRLVNTPPLLGRPLIESDAREGAPPVAVVGYELWQTRFGADSSIVGRAVQLGSTQPTVVGVMPEGFAFPSAHDLWVPLRLDASMYERREGPSLRVIFGRLAPGFTMEEAQTQLTAIGARAAADFPATNQRLRPHVAKYAASFMLRQNDADLVLAIYAVQSMLLAILFVACVNVATLVFARTATRESEIVVRTALGASRWRIIRQLFVEALVLSTIAGIVALVALSQGISWGISILTFAGNAELPFWWNSNLSPSTILFVGILILVSGAVCGIPPALKVTGGHVQRRLQNTHANASSLRFGVLSTILIVTQVAASVSLLTFAFVSGRHFLKVQTFALPFATEEYVSARLTMDGADQDGFVDRYSSVYQEVSRRLAAEPDVLGITFADLLPAYSHPTRRVEIEGAMTESTVPGHIVRVGRVDPAFFDVLRVSMLAGRSFSLDDAEPTRNVVVVNASFATAAFGDIAPIGRRIRYAQDPNDSEGSYEIVGVVPDLAMNPEAFDAPGVYHPVKPGDAYPVYVVAHIGGDDPVSFAPRLQQITPDVDPAMQVHDIRTLEDIVDGARSISKFVLIATSLVSGMVLLLAAAGTYALMSFTVTRRTREIGIRVALGARAQRILMVIFRRALLQLGLGVSVGAGVTLLWFFDDWSVPEFVAICGLMMVVGVIACAIPARRALGIEPTDALRDSA